MTVVTTPAWTVASRCPMRLAVREAWAGKTLARTFMNCEIVRRVQMRGRVLDIGAGERPSYWRFLRRPERLVTVDIEAATRPSVLASLERGLPVRDGAFDTALAFNVFEHIYAGPLLAREIHRGLRPGGRLYCSVPFLMPIHADPYDFFRYTGWALRHLLEGAGFSDVAVLAYGGYFSVLAEHLNRFVRLRPLRTLTVVGCLGLERALDRLAGPDRNAGRFVLGYFAEASRPS